MGHDGAPSLTPQGVKIVGGFCCVELSLVVKDHCSRNAKGSDDIFLNEISELGRSNGGDSLNFYPHGQVIHRNKKVLALSRGLRERFEYIYAPCSKW